MEIDFYIQSQAFLYSLLFGVGLGMLYGIFKFIRVAFLSTKTAVIIADIIFMLIASVALFLYSLAMLYGYVRIYIVFGALCGFLAYRFSLFLYPSIFSNRLRWHTADHNFPFSIFHFTLTAKSAHNARKHNGKRHCCK